MAERVRIAVVGHTNTGKTSLLRTLLRDTSFGEVADAPGTTRHVEGVRLKLDGQPVLAWFDTPGLEDSVALLEYTEQLADTHMAATGERLDGPARIRRFLDTPEARGRFEQEARVLRQMLESDAALYVIDARDPVLGKHRDELALLAACGKPLLPVLNFINAPGHRAEQWRQAMARLGLHASIEFDTVAPALDGEQQLYRRLAVLLESQADTLNALAAELSRQRAQRRQSAATLVADMLIDVAALRIATPPDEDAVRDAVRQLQDAARRREQTCVAALLALYRFGADDYAPEQLPLSGERWDMDLFHPQALKDAGIRVGFGVAAGAAAGATIDLLLAGTSLGAAALAGAAAGGVWQSAGRFGKRLAGKLRGYREVSVDDAVLRLLAIRQLALIDALERRGHAAREPLRLAPPGASASPSGKASGKEDARWRSAALPAELKEARSRPEWSSLGASSDGAHARIERRAAAVRTLSRQLLAPAQPAGQDAVSTEH